MNWSHESNNGIAVNKCPVYGGIVDFNIDGWFAVPNNDSIEFCDGFKTKQDAIDYIIKSVDGE